MFLIMSDNYDTEFNGKTIKIYTKSYFVTKVSQLHRSILGQIARAYKSRFNNIV